MLKGIFSRHTNQCQMSEVSHVWTLCTQLKNIALNATGSLRASRHCAWHKSQLFGDLLTNERRFACNQSEAELRAAAAILKWHARTLLEQLLLPRTVAPVDRKIKTSVAPTKPDQTLLPADSVINCGRIQVLQGCPACKLASQGTGWQNEDS